MLKMLDNPALQTPPFYSQAVAATGSTTLYISGQVGVGPDGAVPESVGEQTKLAVANVNAMLAEAGMDRSNIAKLTIYLTDPAHIGEFAQAAGAPASPPPATTLLIVKALGAPNLLVEIEAIAVK
ncbi:MAG: RidA family protein [Rhizobiaceae bacterium]